MTARILAAVAVLAAPRTAAACAACIDSAFGNRGFTWPFAALMVTPLAVATALAVLFALVRAPAVPAQFLGEASEGAAEAPSDLMETP